MNVLHFCMSRGWGGLEMASFQWARLFHEHGHGSFSICAPNSPLAAKLKQSQLKTNEMDFTPYFSPLQTWQLRRYIVQNSIDAVYLQSLKDLWVVAPALWGLPCKLVGFAQMWLEGINKKDPLHTLIHRRMNHLVTLTPRQGEQMLRCIPFDKANTTVIPNSIDTRRFSPDHRDEGVRKEFGAHSDEILIGLVGRLDPQKGQWELIEAFAEAKKKAPHLPLKLVLVGHPTPGEGESYLKLLRETITKYHLEDDVRMPGFREDVPRTMASLDVFVLNSHMEAFGFVVVEAMASGTPVIATNAGGVPDILHGGEYGWLVPPKDISTLSETLILVASDPVARKSMSQKARSYAQNEFDENKNFNKLLEITENLP